MDRFLVFLDIDGVLREAKPYDGKVLKSCVDVLKDFLEATNGTMVITSTWRYVLDLPAQSLSKLLGIPVEGCCSDLPDGMTTEYTRYAEIKQYLRAHGDENTPWIAIDDMPDHFPSRAPVFVTNPKTGLTSADLPRLIQAANQQQGVPAQGTQDQGVQA